MLILMYKKREIYHLIYWKFFAHFWLFERDMLAFTNDKIGGVYVCTIISSVLLVYGFLNLKIEIKKSIFEKYIGLNMSLSIYLIHVLIGELMFFYHWGNEYYVFLFSVVVYFMFFFLKKFFIHLKSKIEKSKKIL